MDTTNIRKTLGLGMAFVLIFSSVLAFAGTAAAQESSTGTLDITNEEGQELEFEVKSDGSVVQTVVVASGATESLALDVGDYSLGAVDPMDDTNVVDSTEFAVVEGETTTVTWHGGASQTRWTTTVPESGGEGVGTVTIYNEGDTQGFEIVDTDMYDQQATEEVGVGSMWMVDLDAGVEYQIEALDSLNSHTFTLAAGESLEIEHTSSGFVVLEAEEPVGDLDVYVEDSDSLDPLSGATVDLVDALSLDVVTSKTTDSSGLAMFTAPAGDYDVEVSGVDGYSDGYEPATVMANMSETVYVGLEADSDPAPVAEFDYSPVSPVEGDEVTFDAAASTSTGSTTYEWSIDGSTYTGVTAAHTFDIAGDYTAELTVTQEDGQSETTTQTVTVAEDPVETHSVSFDAVDADGNPVEGASISIEDADETEVAKMTTDSDGFASADLKDDNYTYVVAADGFDEVSGDITVDGASETVEVTLNETPTHSVTFEVIETVEDTDGDSIAEPVENATVTLAGETVETDSDGLVSFDALESGDYEVSVAHEDYEDLSTTLTVDADLHVIADFASLTDAESDGFDVGTIEEEKEDEALGGSGAYLDFGGDDTTTIIAGALGIILATFILGLFAKVAGD